MGEAAEHARVLATHAFEHLPAIVGRDADGPLAPGLLLDRMGLIDHPMPDGRQYFAICRNISEQQRVVRHHDIGAGSANARPMHQAFMGEERAKPARALARTRGEVLPVHAFPTNAQRIEVARRALAYICVDDGHSGERIRRVARGHDVRMASHQALELAQAGVVVKPLECTVR